jgi:hypothetical protein
VRSVARRADAARRRGGLGAVAAGAYRAGVRYLRGRL